MSKMIVLLGQPNSGKSTVFNGLTGAHQHVGNWPGKTVERKEGRFTHNGTEYDVIDLPGSGLRWESSWRRLRRQWLLPHRSWSLASGLFRLSAARSERSLSSS